MNTTQSYKFIDIGTHKLAVRLVDMPSEYTIVLEAGGGKAADSYELIQEPLAIQAKTRVLSYDRSGFGQSKWGPAGFTAIDQVDGLKKCLEIQKFNVNTMTVANVRKAFTAGGVEKAINRKKPEREYLRCLDGEAEAHLIALACSAAPDGYESWSLRLLRDRFVKLEIVSHVSHETIRMTLKKRKLNLG